MRSWTYGELKEKVENDLDLIDELFITPNELLSYFNEAIDQAEAEIHKLGCENEYFLSAMNMPLVYGQSEYALPENIYANKIRRIVYSHNNRIYPIERFRGSKMFEQIADTLSDPGSDPWYKYIIKNDSAATGPKIVLFPAAQETNSAAVTIWYIRNANRLINDSDVLDIPEFSSFVIQHVKCRAYEKEGHPNVQAALAVLQSERQLMIETLSEMVPDDDNRVEMDVSYYRDHN